MGKERRQSLNATIHLRNNPFRQRRRGMRRVTVTVGFFAVLAEERRGAVANVMPGGGTESIVLAHPSRSLSTYRHHPSLRSSSHGANRQIKRERNPPLADLRPSFGIPRPPGSRATGSTVLDRQLPENLDCPDHPKVRSEEIDWASSDSERNELRAWSSVSSAALRCDVS
jgi:hypothetical protein